MVEIELELNQERGWETLALWSQPPCEKGELTRFQTVRRSRGFKLFAMLVMQCLPVMCRCREGGRRGKSESRKLREGNKEQKEKEESKRRGRRRGER